jgi:hypothetical protein
MSNEQDFDDVQKTLTDWTYQIVEVDIPTGKVDVECYSIGGIYNKKDNVLVDLSTGIKISLNLQNHLLPIHFSGQLLYL